MSRVRAVVQRLLREFGGNDLKTSWAKDKNSLKMNLYGYEGFLSLEPGRVGVSLRPPSSSNMPRALIRRELETALKKICG